MGLYGREKLMKKNNQELNIESTSEYEGDKTQSQKVLEKFDSDARVRKFKNRNIAIFISVIAVLYSAFHLYITYNPMPALQQRAVHMSVGMGLIFLLYTTFKKQDRSKAPFYDWGLFLLSLLSAGYILYEYTEIVTTRGGIPNTMDIVMAIITVILVFEATRRVTGIILPILAVMFLIYLFIRYNVWLPNGLM